MDKYTPLQLAVISRSQDMVQRCLDHGAPVDGLSVDMVLRHQPSMLKTLVDAGVNPNASSRDGMHPFEYMERYGCLNPEMIVSLGKAGAMTPPGFLERLAPFTVGTSAASAAACVAYAHADPFTCQDPQLVCSAIRKVAKDRPHPRWPSLDSDDFINDLNVNLRITSTKHLVDQPALAAQILCDAA